MIISASRRTDLPAFFMDVFMADLREGFRVVRNPFDARSARRLSLAPEDVDCVVFWTRDPRSLTLALPELEERGFRFYVQMTITGYPASLEPRVPRPDDALEAARRLAGLIGPARLIWRYDPILLAEGMDTDFHKSSFERLCAGMEGSTRRVTISLIDEYAATAPRLARAGFPGAVFGSPRDHGGSAAATGRPAATTPPNAPLAKTPPEPYPALLKELADIAKSLGMEMFSCSEPYDLASYGIAKGACVDAALIRELFGIALPSAKDKGQRSACRCAPSVDVGDYGSCPAGCVYCYARRGR